MEATSLSEARIYVGTYAKYNDGSIEGKWFDLSDFSDKDEFYEACKESYTQTKQTRNICFKTGKIYRKI